MVYNEMNDVLKMYFLLYLYIFLNKVMLSIIIIII